MWVIDTDDIILEVSVIIALAWSGKRPDVVVFYNMGPCIVSVQGHIYVFKLEDI